MEVKIIIIGILVIAIGIIAICKYFYHFECPECREHFQISFFEYLHEKGILFGKHRQANLFSKIKVPCPKCGNSEDLIQKRGKI